MNVEVVLWATWNRRRIATGSLVKASGVATARRSPSRRKPSSWRGRKVCHSGGEPWLAAPAVLEGGHEDARQVADRLGV